MVKEINFFNSKNFNSYQLDLFLNPIHDEYDAHLFLLEEENDDVDCLDV